jgi:hypothetical protein
LLTAHCRYFMNLGTEAKSEIGDRTLRIRHFHVRARG